MKPLRPLFKRARRSPAPQAGHVVFVGAGPGAADLLTVRATDALKSAEVILYDRLISSDVLALAPRHALQIDVGKSAFGPSTPQAEINDLIVNHAREGARVIRLKSGDSTVFGRLDEEIEACDAAGIAWSIVPGITAASAAVATIGQSLTRRGRNASVRLLTGHDTRGFADHDWAALARPGEVAAIYMGKSSARFIRGRLMMHGASGATPVSLVENASRPDQRVIATTLADLSESLDAAALKGPVLTLFGLSPRAAQRPAHPTTHPVQSKEIA